LLFAIAIGELREHPSVHISQCHLLPDVCKPIIIKIAEIFLIWW